MSRLARLQGTSQRISPPLQWAEIEEIVRPTLGNWDDVVDFPPKIRIPVPMLVKLDQVSELVGPELIRVKCKDALTLFPYSQNTLVSFMLLTSKGIYCCKCSPNSVHAVIDKKQPSHDRTPLHLVD